MPPRWRVEEFDCLGSTSDYVLAAARAGAPEGLAVLARAQTAGRGRSGRSWFASSGGLALSVLLRPGTSAEQAGQWSLLAGLVTIEALAHFLPSAAAARLRLKWPNDVVAGGAKLAGILAESELDRTGRMAFLVIGIGANLDRSPILRDRPATALRALGIDPPDPRMLADRLLHRLDQWRLRYAAEGFAPVRAAWLAAAHPPGTVLTVQTPQGVYQGVFLGLDAAGALHLGTSAGDRLVASGEIVTFAEPAPPP